MPQTRFAPQTPWIDIYRQHQAQVQQQQHQTALETALQQMRGQQGMAEQGLRGEQQMEMTTAQQTGAKERTAMEVAGQQKIAELGELGRLLASSEIVIPDKDHAPNTVVNGVPLHKYTEKEHETEKRESEFTRINKTMDLFDKLVSGSPELQAMGKETLAQIKLGFVDPHISNIIQARGEAGAVMNAYTKQAALLSRLKKNPDDQDAKDELKGTQGFLEFYNRKNEFRQHINNQPAEIFKITGEPLGKLMSGMSRAGAKHKEPGYMNLPFNQRLANDFDEATAGMSDQERGAAMMGLQHFGSFFHESNTDPMKAAMANILSGNVGGQGQPAQAATPTPNVAPQTTNAPGAPAQSNANPFAGMTLDLGKR